MNTFNLKTYHAVKHLLLLIIFSLLLISEPFANKASAYYYSGGDWGGANLLLYDGDTLSGTFSNIGLFQINNAAVVTSISEQLGIYANIIQIDGTLKFDNFVYPQLTLSSKTSITTSSNATINANNGTINLIAGTSGALNNDSLTSDNGSHLKTGVEISTGYGTLTNGNSLSLISGGNITVGGNSTLVNGGITQVGGSIILGDGGSLSLATPIPAALPLFGSGLIALGLLRRRKDFNHEKMRTVCL